MGVLGRMKKGEGWGGRAKAHNQQGLCRIEGGAIALTEQLQHSPFCSSVPRKRRVRFSQDALEGDVLDLLGSWEERIRDVHLPNTRACGE